MTPPGGAERGATVDLRVAIVVLLAALAARLVLALSLPPDRIPWPDGSQYAEIARSLLDGNGYGLRALRPPGYPTFMAAVWALTGPSLPVLRIVEALIGTGSVALIGVLGARWFGRPAGTVAMMLAALHPVLAFLPGTQYSENLLVFVLLLVWGLWFGALADPRAGLGRWIAGGALAGYALLVRPTVVLLLVGFGIAAAVALARARRRWLAPALAVAAVIAAVLAPWIVRNHRVHDHWFFVATGGGRALWLGHNDFTTGRGGSIAIPDSALAAELAALPDQVAMDAHLGARARDWMREHPRRTVELYFVRLGSLFALYPETYTRTPFLEQAARLAQGLVTIVVYAGALLGWFALRGSPLRGPMLATILVYSLVHALFFSVLRYRMVVEPLLLWAAGAGWAALWRRRPSREA